ncbi:hypothetical protein AB205_0008700 [Aquarana catesbeiana]|uniref:Uncharacterized protein n=1 Tax=Aquarana catesbeiana TaxID=8400 RepID=A0A2G9S2N3_AQUCT|nr:hypothetical protein AB205_0008700 [Aquarana catesbeiana]
MLGLHLTPCFMVFRHGADTTYAHPDLLLSMWLQTSHAFFKKSPPLRGVGVCGPVFLVEVPLSAPGPGSMAHPGFVLSHGPSFGHHNLDASGS